MALDLLKLVLSATSTSTTTLSPSQNGYYHTVTATQSNTSFAFGFADFLDNAGVTLTPAFPAVSSDGYYTVTINGIQQMADVSALDTTTLTLTFATTETLNVDDIVDVQIVDYTPTTQTATSVE